MENQAHPIVLTATLTCPHCGDRAVETMPTDACQYFWDCPGCGRLLKPEPGDCCVFCSYADLPCPPIQAGDPASCGGAPERRAADCG